MNVSCTHGTITRIYGPTVVIILLLPHPMALQRLSSAPAFKFKRRYPMPSERSTQLKRFIQGPIEIFLEIASFLQSSEVLALSLAVCVPSFILYSSSELSWNSRLRSARCYCQSYTGVCRYRQTGHACRDLPCSRSIPICASTYIPSQFVQTMQLCAGHAERPS